MSDEGMTKLIPVKGSMDEVGTRMQFLLELHDYWTTGLDVLQRYNREVSTFEAQKIELEAAVKLLCFYMEKPYEEKFYKVTIDDMGKPEGYKFYDESNPKTEE